MNSSATSVRATAAASRAASQADVVTTMAQRLAAVERKCHELEQLNVEKDRKIFNLENELKIERDLTARYVRDPPQETSPASSDLDECRTLKNKILELESALTKLGFQLVSDDQSVRKQSRSCSSSVSSRHHQNNDHTSSTESSCSVDANSKVSKSTSSSNIFFPLASSVLLPDLDRIRKNVIELNALCGDGGKEVVASGAKASFQDKETIPIVFYANGLCVNGGFFRPYDWQLTQAFMSDLADGYIPYEFKEKYPDGVLLRIVDKLSHSHSPDVPPTQSTGNVDKKPYQSDFSSLLDEDPGVLDSEKLRKTLPEKIIRRGRIINIREPDSKEISNKLPQDIIVPTEEHTLVCKCMTEKNLSERQALRHLASEGKVLSTIHVNLVDMKAHANLILSAKASLLTVYDLIERACDTKLDLIDLSSREPILRSATITLEDANFIPGINLVGTKSSLS